MQAIGYVRVSKADRRKPKEEQRRSLDAQQAAIERAAAYNGWELLEVYEDLGKTGANTRRDGLQGALALLKRKQADMLIIGKHDRLSRDTRDWLDLLFDSSKQGWAISVLDQKIDTSTASGWFHAVLQAVFAEYERRIIGERTKAALAVLKASGKRLGRPSPIPPDVATGIIALHAEGLSASAIARRLNDDNVASPSKQGKWHHTAITGLLKRAAAST
jgi:DNA invertase Pin-like site-specific DNA recombinase